MASSGPYRDMAVSGEIRQKAKWLPRWGHIHKFLSLSLPVCLPSSLFLSLSLSPSLPLPPPTHPLYLSLSLLVSFCHSFCDSICESLCLTLCISISLLFSQSLFVFPCLSLISLFLPLSLIFVSLLLLLATSWLPLLLLSFCSPTTLPDQCPDLWIPILMTSSYRTPKELRNREQLPQNPELEN